MANLTLRLVKGVPLTNAEVDSNFSNLNISKVEIGRDLSGNIYYPVVSGIQGRDVSSTAPSNAQVLTWLTASNAWAPASIIIPEVPVTVANILLTGDVSGSANAVLTANSTLFSISTTIQPNSVALGTDTSGPYVSNITVGSGLTVSGTADEGNVVTLAHADTSSTANVSSDNSDGTVIQDVSLGFDTFGHVTSASVATVNLDNRFVRLSTGTVQTVTGPMSFEGNVTFAGNVTTIAANNLVITDNFIYLNSANTQINVDIGFAGNYNDGTYRHAGFFRDASDNGTWKIFEHYLPEPSATVNIDTANASFKLANLAVNKITANDIVSGNIIPSANLTYNLGSPTRRFKDLYLSGNTINLGGALLSASGNSVSISSIDNTPIGETTRSTGKFTNLAANVLTANILFMNDIVSLRGTRNFIVGANAAPNIVGEENFIYGNCAGYSANNASQNFIFGYKAGQRLTDVTGSYNGIPVSGATQNFIAGYCAGANLTTQAHNIMIGFISGMCANEGDGYNTFIGYGTGALYTGACGFCGRGDNIFIGASAGILATGGAGNNFLGNSAGRNNSTGCFNNFLGIATGICNSTGCFNNFLGKDTGFRNTSGSNNNFLGETAGYYSTSGSNNNFFGAAAGYSTCTGSHNNFFGRNTGFCNTTGSYNFFAGFCAGYYNTTGGHNLFIGAKTGFCNTTATNNIFIGQCAGYCYTDPAGNNTIIGTVIGCGGCCVNNTLIIATGSCQRLKVDGNGFYVNGALKRFIFDTEGCCNITSCLSTPSGTFTGGCYNFFAGFCAGSNATGGSDNNFIGKCAGKNNTTGNSNTFFGSLAGFYNTTGSNNTFIGQTAGAFNTTGNNNFYGGYRSGFGGCSASNNVVIGACAGAGGYGVSGSTFTHNVIMGCNAGTRISTGAYNNFLGLLAGGCNTTGSNNNFFGNNAGRKNTTGTNNVFIGNFAGTENTIGERNVFLGASAGACNSSGSDNFFTGCCSGACNSTGSNNLFLGKSAGGNISTGGDNIVFGCLNNNVGFSNTTSNTIIMATSGIERLRVQNGNLSILSCSGNVIASQGFFDNLIVKNVSEYVANTATYATTTESTLFEFSKNVYSSGKFTITGKQGSNVQISEMLVAQDGTTASSTEYGVVKTSNVTVFTGNVDISGNNVRVRVIGGTAISTKYTLAGTLLDL